jgi:hypothetical protein
VSQTATGGSGKAGGPKYLLDHDYHEISDEEGAVESPRFEVRLLELILNSLSLLLSINL